MPAAAAVLPCFRLVPYEDELVMFYLLPRARGGPAPYPGVIIEDNTAGTALPMAQESSRAEQLCGDQDEQEFWVSLLGGLESESLCTVPNIGDMVTGTMRGADFGSFLCC